MIPAQELHLESPAGGPLDLIVRTLTAEEYGQCEKLQRHTWGDDFSEIVPASMMMINQKLGGVLAGAFDREGRLVAFVFGQTGVRRGKLFHWSHMLGVRSELRGFGLGRYLKLFQRRFLLELGVEEVEWTYDPLESRNAHLNLNRLGAEPVDYRRDVYGDGMSSSLHEGIGTDRFVVRWRLADPRVESRIAGAAQAQHDDRDAPAVNLDAAGALRAVPFELPELPIVRVAVPADIQTVKSGSMGEAKGWRAGTRLSFETYLERRYRILRFDRDPTTQTSYYVLFQP